MIIVLLYLFQSIYSTTIEEVIQFISEINYKENKDEMITVYGWQFYYQHEMRTNVIGYLSENLTITENIAPLGNYNRPGDKHEKKYICVHDTGDSEYTAKQWSQTVYNGWNEQSNSAYLASFQYVIDNNDCYHNIPDDERARHAGDGERLYEEFPTGIYGTNEDPIITIENGYFKIDDQITSIQSPLKNGKPSTTEDINDQGIRCFLKDGEYYMGNTWLGDEYPTISNTGGNTNSIGIETCINYGSDVFYSWQRLAKLVAQLMDENNLTIRDVVGHHYFSGKHCPQTMREAGMWNYFKTLVSFEFKMRKFIQEGFSFKFISHDLEYLNNSGRVIKTPEIDKEISFSVIISKDGIEKEMIFSSIIKAKE